MPGLAYRENELHGQKRVSSQQEEVVIDAHTTETKYLGPQP